MDPISQGTVGAVFAQSVANKNNIAIIGFVGFLAGLAPDLDVFIDQDGTSWSAEGLAASGVQMSQVSAQRSFAMCWFANHSNSAIALIDLQDKTTETPEDEEGSGE